MMLGQWYVSVSARVLSTSLRSFQALEEGEDLQELTDRARERKERRVTNKLLKEVEVSRRGTPASDADTNRGRKGKKGKGKATDYEPNAGSKRKRGMKSMSVTPSVNGDDEDEPDQVIASIFTFMQFL
jgi:ATP-dependent helicase STH1/SNF2